MYATVTALTLNDQQELIIAGICRFKNLATSIGLQVLFENAYSGLTRQQKRDALDLKSLRNPRTLITALAEMERMELLRSKKDGEQKYFSITPKGHLTFSRTIQRRVNLKAKSE